MARIAKAWPCAASAFLLLAAFPPFHLSLLVFVALIPWLLSLREKGASGFRSGWTFGFLYALGQMFWLIPFVGKWTGSIPLALVPWLLSGFVVAPFFGLVGWLARTCWKNDWPWLIPVVWAGVEVLRSYVPVLAFPWGLVASPLADMPYLMGLGHYGMIFLASAWVVMVNVWLAQWMGGEPFVRWRTAFIVAFVGLGLSFVYWSQPVSGTEKTIMIGQPGVDMAFGDPRLEPKLLQEDIDPITARALLAKADLLVLPEGVGGAAAQMPPRVPFHVDEDVPVIFGGQRGDEPRYQTAFAYDRGKWTYADKTRLVIFGEFVPGRNWIPFLSAFNLPSGDLSAAREVKALDVNGIRVGPLLCFEGLFPDLGFRQAMNGAKLLAVMSIDDWYMGTPAPEQLAMGAPWRAVETGLPVVRAATTGISMACNARGDVTARAPVGQTRAVPVQVLLPIGSSYFHFSPVFPIVALLSLFVVPLIDYWRRRSKKA